MADANTDWDERYKSKDTPWDSGQPSQEILRVLQEWSIAPCACLELGCGTGTNAIHLASLGYSLTATDVSSLAIEQAKKKAEQAGASVEFIEADLLANPHFGGPFPFVFDRGVYHILRKANLEAMRKILLRHTAPGSIYLTLAGNANDTAPDDRGPPRVTAIELVTELEPHFELVQLREFRFAGVVVDGKETRPLGWSAIFRRTCRSTPEQNR